MLVLDSSAAISLVFERPEAAALRSLAYEGEKVIAPELYVAEMAHVIERYVRGQYVDAATGVTLLGKSWRLVDELVPMKELAQEVLSESLRLDHSSYDVFYFVLARRNAATLCTLDRRLQRFCLKNGVNCVCGLDVDDERWTVRVESEVGPAGMGGITREELERAVGRDTNGV